MFPRNSQPPHPLCTCPQLMTYGSTSESHLCPWAGSKSLHSDEKWAMPPTCAAQGMWAERRASGEHAEYRRSAEHVLIQRPERWFRFAPLPFRYCWQYKAIHWLKKTEHRRRTRWQPKTIYCSLQTEKGFNRQALSSNKTAACQFRPHCAVCPRLIWWKTSGTAPSHALVLLSLGQMDPSKKEPSSAKYLPTNLFLFSPHMATCVHNHQLNPCRHSPSLTVWTRWGILFMILHTLAWLFLPLSHTRKHAHRETCF